MIADYEAPDRAEKFASARPYGLSQTHKHLPEMVGITGLEAPPVFCPIVADYLLRHGRDGAALQRAAERRLTASRT